MNIGLKDIRNLFSDAIWTMDTRGTHRLWRGLVRLIKLVRITVSTFTQNRMGFQCVSLSYFIALAIVPFSAFLFAVTGGLGLSDRLSHILHTTFPANPEFIDLIMEKAANIISVAQSGGVGIISALMFFWAILWMMFQVERVFNNVWGILRIPRKIYTRFGFYFLILFLSPFVVLLFGTGIAFYLNLPNLIGLDVSHLKFLPKILGWVGFYVFITFTLSAMYKFIPAVPIRYKYALKSALLTAVVFALFQYIYLETQVFVARLNAVYGVLAAVPLFLIWLNFCWQIIIYGAELTYSYHNIDSYNLPAWEKENY